MSDVAASGGYYIACGASKIIAEPSTITGSIGVVAGKPVLRGFYDWIGVSNEYILRGKNAGMFRETEKFTLKSARSLKTGSRQLTTTTSFPRSLRAATRMPLTLTRWAREESGPAPRD